MRHVISKEITIDNYPHLMFYVFLLLNGALMRLSDIQAWLHQEALLFGENLL